MGLGLLVRTDVPLLFLMCFKTPKKHPAAYQPCQPQWRHLVWEKWVGLLCNLASVGSAMCGKLSSRGESLCTIKVWFHTFSIFWAAQLLAGTQVLTPSFLVEDSQSQGLTIFHCKGEIVFIDFLLTLNQRGLEAWKFCWGNIGEVSLKSVLEHLFKLEYISF